MQISFHLNKGTDGKPRGGTITVKRDNDKPIHGMKFAKGEHYLFHRIKQQLNKWGFDLIKKRAQKDGHMIGDEYQPYLRIKGPKSQTPHIYIWSGFYALRGANEDFNKGEVCLLVETDVNEKQPDCIDRIVALGKQHNFPVTVSVHETPDEVLARLSKRAKETV